MADVRLPYEPLARIVAARIGLPYCDGRRGADGRPCSGCNEKAHAGPSAVAKYLGFNASTPLKWRSEGIPLDSAERACDAIAVHPSAVPGWNYDEVVVGELDEVWLTAWDEGRIGPDGSILSPEEAAMLAEVPAVAEALVGGRLFDPGEPVSCGHHHAHRYHPERQHCHDEQGSLFELAT